MAQSSPIKFDLNWSKCLLSYLADTHKNIQDTLVRTHNKHTLTNQMKND
jgi:hypothetical protein